MRGYTFRMRLLLWFTVIGAIGGIALWFWKARERWKDKQRESEQRFAEMMAQLKPTVAPTLVKVEAPEQRLLFDAAGKAAAAGEPVLSIQLYARLLARYPDTQFAAQAKAAVESQKKKLAKA
jgi:hypothetical protein